MKILEEFDEVHEILGWIGTAMILLAYAFVSFGVLSSQDLAYQLLNLLGALGIVIVSLKKKAYPPAFLNIIWFGIALFAIASLLL